MECGQGICVSKAEKVWEVMKSYEQHHLVHMIAQCALWLIFVCAFHYCLWLMQMGDPKARYAAHQVRSKRERDAISQFWSARRPRSHPGEPPETAPSATTGPNEVPVPMLMSVQCRPLCARKSRCAEKLKQVASDLSAPGHDVVCVSGLFLQTHSMLSAVSADKLADIANNIAAEGYCDFILQQSTWRACCVSSEGLKDFELREDYQVPVILHSSSEAGNLTIEGLHLAQATIQIASKESSMTFETSPSSEGANLIEIHKSIRQLPIKNLDGVSVLAFKRIDVGGHSVKVRSLAVPIQDDNFRTVLRFMSPFTTIVMCGAMHTLLSMMGLIMPDLNTTAMVAWTLPALMLFIAIRVQSRSTETSIEAFLRKYPTQIYTTLSCALHSFWSCEEDAYFVNMNESDQECHPGDTSTGPGSNRSDAASA